MSLSKTRSDTVECQRSRSLPPWLWFWLVGYAFAFPANIATWRDDLNALFFSKTSPIDIGIAPHFYFLMPFTAVPELVPSLMLLVGVLTIFVPWIRAAWLERHFNLAASPSTVPALKEVSEFVHRYAPDLRIKVNLRRFDQLAFVYPLGYRTAAIAIFGGLIMRWRADRQAAEAMLLHEIAHYRNGDTLIVGAGSFFELVARSWLPISFFFLLIPNILVACDQWLTFIQEGIQRYLSLGIPIPFSLYLSLFPGLVFPILSESLALLLNVARILVLPLIGIWCAELNADQFVLDMRQSPEALAHALEKFPSKTSRWHWLLFRMSHPPDSMRRWLIFRSKGMREALLLLLLFPMAYFIKLVVMQGWALILLLSSGIGINDTVTNLVTDDKLYLEGIAPSALAMAVLLLLWPFVARYWQRSFGRERSTANALSYAYQGYALSAIAMACLTVLCYSLYFLGK